jgi:hypothetical protein
VVSWLQASYRFWLGQALPDAADRWPTVATVRCQRCRQKRPGPGLVRGVLAGQVAGRSARVIVTVSIVLSRPARYQKDPFVLCLTAV